MKKRDLANLWIHRSIFGRFWEPQKSPKMVPQGWLTSREKPLLEPPWEHFASPTRFFFNFHSQNGSPKDPRGPPELPKIIKNRGKNDRSWRRKKRLKQPIWLKKGLTCSFFGKGLWVIGLLLGCWVVELFFVCWIVVLLGCLLGCWVVGSLGCWVVGLLCCWLVGLLGCWVGATQQKRIQGN